MDINDTRRLDFVLLHNPVFDFDWRSGAHWIVFRKDSRKCMAEGQTHRECIDKALQNLYVYVD